MRRLTLCSPRAPGLGAAAAGRTTRDIEGGEDGEGGEGGEGGQARLKYSGDDLAPPLASAASHGSAGSGVGSAGSSHQPGGSVGGDEATSALRAARAAGCALGDAELPTVDSSEGGAAAARGASSDALLRDETPREPRPADAAAATDGAAAAGSGRGSGARARLTPGGGSDVQVAMADGDAPSAGGGALELSAAGGVQPPTESPPPRCKDGPAAQRKEQLLAQVRNEQAGRACGGGSSSPARSASKLASMAHRGSGGHGKAATPHKRGSGPSPGPASPMGAWGKCSSEI